ncbi:hypothetical protein P167DRAFT_547064 [Morchella conica CCBAS932]|uniref:3'-5' exonuclease domain-containing protein n=1 Tax=Morchella conica CCBAS932 TaxID=1392247 RepID=A0A3N4KMT5_9PEZI|nr:hypothetical protein P167DRAFT_547064 [Morchella conica CCBAS932]
MLRFGIKVTFRWMVLFSCGASSSTIDLHYLMPGSTRPRVTFLTLFELCHTGLYVYGGKSDLELSKQKENEWSLLRGENCLWRVARVLNERQLKHRTNVSNLKRVPVEQLLGKWPECCLEILGRKYKYMTREWSMKPLERHVLHCSHRLYNRLEMNSEMNEMNAISFYGMSFYNLAIAMSLCN